MGWVDEKEELIRFTEILLQVVMILAFVHFADVAWDARVQYGRMASYAESLNRSPAGFATGVNISPPDDRLGRSLYRRDGVRVDYLNSSRYCPTPYSNVSFRDHQNWSRLE